MQLTLRINGEFKVMRESFISGLTMKKYNRLREKVDYLYDKPTEEQLDALIGVISEAFDKQFTIDEFYAGLRKNDFQEKIAEFVLIAEGLLDENGESVVKPEDFKQEDFDATPSDTDGAS
ncbi:hypothetical protein V7195_25765 [Priestia megaterium]|uniref:phage tail assembly chaperone G n=1 Tax=Priestia megaterium TaxID=1404 RepID=UPI000BF66A4C|nr:hypothetical protein [Priestia megaterium]PFK01976.1 hypothetical protein COI96_06170 [Priestia megaterium]PMD08157.1 hypothetical protein CJ194_19360 [Priestia megaterium]